MSSTTLAMCGYQSETHSPALAVLGELPLAGQQGVAADAHRREDLAEARRAAACRARFVSSGLGSNRSMWLGPPSMNRKMQLFGLRREVRRPRRERPERVDLGDLGPGASSSASIAASASPPKPSPARVEEVAAGGGPVDVWGSSGYRSIGPRDLVRNYWLTFAITPRSDSRGSSIFEPAGGRVRRDRRAARRFDRVHPSRQRSRPSVLAAIVSRVGSRPLSVVVNRSIGSRLPSPKARLIMFCRSSVSVHPARSSADRPRDLPESTRSFVDCSRRSLGPTCDIVDSVRPDLRGSSRIVQMSSMRFESLSWTSEFRVSSSSMTSMLDGDEPRSTESMIECRRFPIRGDQPRMSISRSDRSDRKARRLRSFDRFAPSRRLSRKRRGALVRLRARSLLPSFL